jgi:hypothetical protein
VERIKIKKMNKIKLTLFVLSAIFMQSCANQSTAKKEEATPQAETTTNKLPNPQLEGQWTILHIKGVKLVKNTHSIYMKVDLQKKTISGSDSCNNYTGMITTVTDSELVFSPVASTLRLCPEVEYDGAFHTALQETVSYKIEQDNLHLFNKEGEEVLTFLKKNEK